MEDIRQTGPVGLTGINRKKTETPEIINIKGTPVYYTGDIPSSYGIGEVLPFNSSTGDLGSSAYDEDVLTLEQIENVENMRALNQPGALKLINGVTKGGVLAGTTFLNGTLGTIYGLGSAILNIGNKEESGVETFSRIWDNEVTNGLTQINEWAERVLPNYRTTEERENKWYQNLGTVNFWADTFLKNMGFTVGAYFSGKAAIGLLSKVGLIKSGLGAATTGAIYGAVNEAAIEANNNSTDMFKLEQQRLNDAFEQSSEEILSNPTLTTEQKQAAMNNLGEQMQSLQDELDEKKAKMGLITFVGNSVFLSMNDLFTMGRLYAKGFHRARREGLGKIHAEAAQLYAADQNIGQRLSKEGGEWVERQITKGEAARKGVTKAVLEGNEELFQKFISSTAGEKYNADSPDAYYNALNDPKATIETEKFLDAVIKGFADSYGNGDSYEEFAVGFLTGALGIPTFGRTNNSDSSTYLGRNKTIGLSGGILGEFAMANSANKELAEARTFMNEYEQKLAKNKEHFIRSEAFTNAMSGWAEANNAFEYKNMEDNDDFVAIARYAVMGKLDHLKALVNQDFANLSDEVLSNMINETASPYAGYIKADGTPDTAKLKKDLENKKKEILTNIDTFENVFLQTQNEVNEVLSQDQMTELAWLKWKQSRFVTRYADMLKEFPKFYTALNDNLSKWEEAISALKAEELNIPGLSNTEKGVKILKQFLDILNKNSDIGSVAYFLNDNKQLLDMLSSQEFYDSFGRHSTLTESDYKSIITIMRDVARIASAHKTFDQRYKEFIADPHKIANQRVEETKRKEEIKKTINKTEIINNLENSTAVSLVQQALAGDVNLDELAEQIDLGAVDTEQTEAQTKVQEAMDILEKRKAIIDETLRQKEAGEIDDVVANDIMKVLDANVSTLEESEQFLNMETQGVFETALDDLESDKTLTSEEYETAHQTRLDVARSKINQMADRIDDLVGIIEDPTPSKESPTTGHDTTPVAQSVQENKREAKQNSKEDKKLTEILEKLPSLVDPEYLNEVRNNVIIICRAAKHIIYNGTPKEDTIRAIKDMPQYSDEENVLDPTCLANNSKVFDLVLKYIDSFYQTTPAPKTPKTTDNKEVTEELEVLNPSKETLADMANVDSSARIDTDGAWMSSTREYPMYDKRDMTPYHFTEEAQRRYTPEQLKKMAVIYQYLKEKGAFALRNTKEIKEGDEVFFIVDPSLNEKAGSTVILIADKNGRILGDLTSPEFASFEKMTFLKDTYDAIINEYNEANKDGNLEGIFKSKITSKIAQTLVGRVQYTDDYNTLNSIFTTVNSEGGTTQHPFMIAVTVDDAMHMTTTGASGTTKGKDPIGESVMKPLKQVAKGTPFVLVPTNKNGKNAYMPVPFNLPHFGSNTRNVGLGKIIRSILQQIPSITTNAEALRLAEELSAHSGKTWTEVVDGKIKSKRSWNVSISTKEISSEGIKKQVTEVGISYKPDQNSNNVFSIAINSTTDPTAIENFINDVETQMVQHRIPLRINRRFINKEINGESYNALLGALATTNIMPGMITTVNNWFTITPVKADGSLQSVKKIKSTKVNPTANTSNQSNRTIQIEGKDGVVFYVDSQWNITDSKGNVYDKKDPKVERIIAHAYGIFKNLDMTKPYQVSNRMYDPISRQFVTTEAPKQEIKAVNQTTENILTKEDLIAQLSKKVALNTPKLKALVKVLSVEQLITINGLNPVIASSIIKTLNGKFNTKTNTFSVDVDALIDSKKPKAMEVNDETFTNYKQINVDKEIAWLERVLPQFKDRVALVKGLINLKEGVNSDKAYGLFYNGTIILSDIATRGTLYHETFHAVTNVLLDESERKQLFEEAAKRYGDRPTIALEESLAEDFRKYMIAEDLIGGKVVKFFRKIKHYIQSFLGKESYINNLFYNISQGNFANREVSKDNYDEIAEYHTTKYNYNNMSSDGQEYVKSIGFTAEQWGNISRETKEAIMECR